jgi:hypothetical protein
MLLSLSISGSASSPYLIFKSLDVGVGNVDEQDKFDFRRRALIWHFVPAAVFLGRPASGGL